MTEIYEMGSLANLISGGKSASKLSKTSASQKGVKIIFETIKKGQKRKYGASDMVERPPKHEGSANIVSEQSRSFQQSSAKKKRKVKSEFSHAGQLINRETNATYGLKTIKKKKRKGVQLDTWNITTEDEESTEHSVNDQVNCNESDDGKERQIFVGNVPINITKSMLKVLFSKYGKLESIRIRSAPVADTRIPKKVAVINKQFHTDRKSMNVYVRFKKRESAEKALALNGTLYKDHHLKVDLSRNDNAHHDLKKSVFLGNVPFGAEDDDLWKMFKSCGTISSVRIIRDTFTGIGKGFAYVNFESADAVELALQLDGEELSKRKLRVRRCMEKGWKQRTDQVQHEKGKTRGPRNPSFQKVKSDEKSKTQGPTNPTFQKVKSEKNSIPPSSFQGQKFEDKKSRKGKKKFIKTDKGKMAKIKKFRPGLQKKKLKFSLG